MTATAWTYVAYLVVCVGITFWVGRTLRKHGPAFLKEALDEDRGLADGLSHLLVVGFYLVNLGVISFALKTEEFAADAQSAIELVSTKIGTILVVLGAMHFLILAIFSKVRKAAERDDWERNHRTAVGDLAAARQRGAQ